MGKVRIKRSACLLARMFKEEIASIYKQHQLFFWSDLAKALYVKLVISWLVTNLLNNGELVPESSNPPNFRKQDQLNMFGVI